MKKIADIALLLCLAAVLFAVPALTLVKTAHNTVSYYENRSLSAQPKWTAESFWSGEYFNDWETWYADHVPGRTTLLTLGTAIQMDVMRKPVVNDVIVTQDVLLPFLRYGTWDTGIYADKAAPVADQLQSLNDYVEGYGGTFLFVGLPEQSNYFWDKYPHALDNRRWNATAADAAFYGALEERDVPYLDMGAVYDLEGRPDEYYSAVDHHFTYYGAFAAYQAVMDDLNQTFGINAPALSKEDLNFRQLPNPYLGSRNRKLYDLWPNSEHAVIGELKTPIPFTRTDNGQTVDAAVYALPATDTRRTNYDLYMGGDQAETIIDTNRSDLPDILIVGDSFTDALETLFYASFDEMRSLDLRYYTEKTLPEYLADYHPDVVLCVRDDTAFYTATGNGAVWN